MKNKIKHLMFPFIGLMALVWFLIRVIPKPTRATYPCMRAAAPLASSFVVYIIGLGTFTLLMRKTHKFIRESKYRLASIFLFTGLIVGIISLYSYTKNTELNAQALQGLQVANNPMGVGVGINPGRVAWIYNPDAINENCPNTEGDYWYMNGNTNQSAVNKMLSDGLQLMTSTTSDKAAWDALFKYFNNNRGKGEVGYRSGEQFVIKINLNAVWGDDIDANINTSPQICYAILNQLINVVGVPQSDIHIGDPSHEMNSQTINHVYQYFPNVKYFNYNGDWETRSNTVFYSSDGEVEDDMPASYTSASYLINIPVFKKHHRAGISVCSKNHFGSVNAALYHYSLPCPAPEFGVGATNGEYGTYRCFVDIMGHKDLGGKTILYLVDALWGSTNYSHPPIKFAMSPFNNDYPSSLFLSQDPVAIESVCFDFLYEEFDEDHPTEGSSAEDQYDKGPYPHFPATDDFLHQAADPANWPDGIEYDPEKDGTILSSLGTHEHWNNAADKLYSRNLGENKGIELILKNSSTSVFEHTYLLNQTFLLEQNYPNPFSSKTCIKYKLQKPSKVNLSIYDLNGRKIMTLTNMEQTEGMHEQFWDGTLNNGSSASPGAYFYTLEVVNGIQVTSESKTLILK